MKRQAQKIGVRKYFGADLVELQSEPLKALDTFFAEYGPCVIQGCEITATSEGKYNVATGLVALMAPDLDGVERVLTMPFEGVSNIELPLYLRAQCTTIERIYGDGKEKPIAYNYIAVIVDGNPDNEMYCLVLTSEGDNRFVDVLQDPTHRFISDAERTRWNEILASAKLYTDAARTDTNTALSDKAALVPHSTTEQIVPGEFWIGTDNVSRQVYQRTFVDDFVRGVISKVLLTGIRECFMIAGGYTPLTGGFFNNTFLSINNTTGTSVDFKYIINIWVGGTNLNLQFAGDSSIIIGTKYSITVKYTKI